MEAKINTYIDWFNTDNSEPYDELRWMIDLLLDSEHQDKIKDALDSTYKWKYNE